MTETRTGAPLVLARAFLWFFRLEAAGGILLLAAAAAALVWANSPAGPGYVALWSRYVTIGVGELAISKPLLLWINDGLMAVFFLFVGLEIKREVLVGELASPAQAALPIAAAIGGMLVPAAFYVYFNPSSPGIDGWAVPMATDIAFALGILALLGSRAPASLKIFLTALAIVDDLGAVLVIALFYTGGLSATALLVAATVYVALFAINRAGIRALTPYVVLGLLLWIAVLKSGVHATIAGVLLAFVIPARNRAGTTGEETLTLADDAPLLRMEHALAPWVAFAIMPIFALANAGVVFAGGIGELLGQSITRGVLVGLVAGKQVGVLLFAWGAVRIGWAVLPSDLRWSHIHGAGWLAGIGFTMSLFIAGMAYPAVADLEAAKVGILLASTCAAVIGIVVLLLVTRRSAGAAATP